MKRSNFVLVLIAVFLITLAVIFTSSTQISQIGRIATIFLGVLGSLSALSEVLGLFEKIGIPEYILESTPKFIERHRVPFETSVAIWGPIASGKSWLLHAFGKSIYEFSEKQSKMPLHYELHTMVMPDNFEAAPTVAPLNIPGTAIPSLEIYRFERRRTNNNFDQILSSFTHNISMLDNKGGDLINLVIDKYRNSDNGYERVLLSLANADVVIVVLDPTGVNRVQLPINGSLFAEDFWQTSFSKKQYAEMVSRLFSVLEKANSKKKRFYAVCVTKVDQIPEGIFVHPDALIELYFGTEMTNVLIPLKNLGKLETFSTSASGFLKHNGRTIPNFSSGALLSTDAWEPYGVEYPFFWAFEKIETELLSEMLNKGFWNKLTAKNKLKRYIPYPKPQYRI